jgi:hypothetical protein
MMTLHRPSKAVLAAPEVLRLAGFRAVRPAAPRHCHDAGRGFVIFQCSNRKLTIVAKRADREQSNMSSLQSSEGTQVNEGVEAFSKLESEIGELVLRDVTAPRNDDELNVGSLVHTQVNEGVEAFSKLESEIGELARRNATSPRLQQGNDSELNVGSLLEKMSGTSVQDVETLIAELQMLRGKLQNEAARVQREMMGYAVLLQDARKSIGIISDSLSFWKKGRGH